MGFLVLCIVRCLAASLVSTHRSRGSLSPPPKTLQVPGRGQQQIANITTCWSHSFRPNLIAPLCYTMRNLVLVWGRSWYLSRVFSVQFYIKRMRLVGSLVTIIHVLSYLWNESESEVAQSCPTLCDPMDYSLPGSSIHGIFQARVLEWVAISFSRGSSWPLDRTWVSRIASRLFTVWATRETW